MATATGESTIENGYMSFEERIQDLKNQIDSNINILINHTKYIQEQELKNAVDQMVSRYELIYNDAVQSGPISNTAIQDKYVEDLLAILNYGSEMIASVNAQSYNNENLPATRVVTGSEPIAASDTVEMENVGPLREWWNGMSESKKTLLKAVVITGIVIGGKYLVENLIKKFKFKKEEKKPRISNHYYEDYDEEEEEE